MTINHRQIQNEFALKLTEKRTLITHITFQYTLLTMPDSFQIALKTAAPFAYVLPIKHCWWRLARQQQLRRVWTMRQRNISGTQHSINEIKSTYHPNEQNLKIFLIINHRAVIRCSMRFISNAVNQLERNE